MRQALKNILKKEEPIVRHVRVVRRLSGSKYKVVDAYGRETTANSSLTWKPTQHVAIQAGEIIREVGKFETLKRYSG